MRFSRALFSLVFPLSPLFAFIFSLFPFVSLPIYCRSDILLLAVLNVFLRCPPWCWMVCLPSRRFCLPLFPIISFCLPLFPIISPACFPLDNMSVCRGSCLPLLDGVSAFPRLLFPFPIVSFLFSLVGWYVRLSEEFVSFCFLSYSFMFPFIGFSLCLPWCPFLFSLVGWCILVCRSSRGLVYPSTLVSPSFPTCVPACFGWCVRLPEVLSPLFVSHCYSPYIYL